MISKKKSAEDILFSIDDFNVYRDSEYKIEKKIDRSGPPELVAIGSSKYPGAPDTIHCQYSRSGKCYDTGFYESSPMYAGKDLKEVKVLVKTRVENVLKPFLGIRGLQKDSDNSFGPSDTDNWDNFSVRLEEGKIFSTRDPEKVMELYVALNARVLAPADLEESSEYASANFKVVNINEKTKKKSTTSLKLKEADSVFFTLFKNDLERLVDILTYIPNIGVPSNPTEDTLLILFDNVVKPSTNNLDKFLELYEKSQSDLGLLEIKLHRKIKNSVEFSKNGFSKVKGTILYKGKELGKSPKEAAQAVSTLKEFSSLSDEIITQSDD